jgi:hypothetical protein
MRPSARSIAVSRVRIAGAFELIAPLLPQALKRQHQVGQAGLDLRQAIAQVWHRRPAGAGSSSTTRQRPSP